MLVRLLTLRASIGTQPQRDVDRLYRLPYHPYHLAGQLIQVCLVPELGREDFYDLGRVVLPAVEAHVNERLDAPPQGIEQRRYHEGGGYYGQLRLLLLSGEGPKYRLGRRHAADVDPCEQDGERAVDQGAVYHHVYVVEAVAQNRDADGGRY